MGSAFEHYSKLDRALLSVMAVPQGERQEAIKLELLNHPRLHSVASRLADFASSTSLDRQLDELHRALPSLEQPEETWRGRAIEAYDVDGVIGYGGMGQVLLATDRRVSRKVALKLLPHGYRSRGLRKRLLEEARTLAQLQHNGIVQLFDIIGDGSSEDLVLVLEYVPGRDLTDVIAEGPIQAREFRNLTLQICEAVAATHRAGFIHRDLKPSNIRVKREERSRSSTSALHGALRQDGNRPTSL